MITLGGFIHRALGMPFVEKGRDYKGGDCWAIPYLAYRDICNVNLESYIDGYTDTGYTVESRKELENLIDKEKNKVLSWSQIDFKDRKPLDIVLFKIGDMALHCGLLLGQKYFIHSRPKAGVVVERITDLRWFSRIDGIYRPVLNG